MCDKYLQQGLKYQTTLLDVPYLLNNYKVTFCTGDLWTTNSYSIMEEVSSVCKRSLSIRVSNVKYLCVPCVHLKQTVNEVEYFPMKRVGVRQACQQRPDKYRNQDKEADTTPELHSTEVRTLKLTLCIVGIVGIPYLFE